MPLLLPSDPTPSILLQGQRLSKEHATTFVEFRPVDLRLRGFPPKSFVTVTAARRMSRWRSSADGVWRRESVRLVAWATVQCGSDGGVALDRAKITSGSFQRSGSAGLFWSGYLLGDPAISAGLALPPGDLPAEGEIAIHARTQDGPGVGGNARATEPTDVRVVSIATREMNGAFAYPVGARKTRGLISLHRSEGGSVSGARSRAIQFASRGIPTLALNYFAWPNEAIPDLATSNLNTPVELLDRARSWLVARPEIDPRRIGLCGVSKGAEFALVGASTYPWVKAAVALVPSDAVWEGYPTPPRRGRESTWSLGGQPLPYIPIYDPEPGKFRVNTDRYELSRHDRPTEAKAALIPIERSRANILLLASDRDEVWASGAMARSIVARMRRFGKVNQVEAQIYPLAGHQISGPGLFPVRLYGEPSTDPRDKSLDAEGEATVDAWARTIRFLERKL